jgi:hypothetical protein
VHRIVAETGAAYAPLIATLRGDAQSRLIAHYCRLYRSPAGRRTSDLDVLFEFRERRGVHRSSV